MQEQINTNKETIFYASKLTTRGLMLISFVIGLFTYSVFSMGYAFFSAWFLTFLICVVLFIFMFYKGFINRVILKVDKKGIFFPRLGFISWNDIQMISRTQPRVWEDDENITFGVVLNNGTVYRLNMFLFSESQDDLVRILKTYQGTI
jgi:hypothetical protein